MKALNFIAPLFLLTLVVGCNDVSSNRKKGTAGKPEVTRPGVEPYSADLVRSQMHRTSGIKVMSYTEEITATLNNALPVLYRIVPLMEKDDEGSSANVTTRGGLGRSTLECGTGSILGGIDSRISDCLEKNKEKSSWEGNNYGAAGEGLWKLVTRTAEGSETWLDARTGMVWSDLIKKENISSFNWCQASGNDQDNTSELEINCRTLGDLVSLCNGSELAGLSGKVKWRLPTRNDFLQADLNGLRFVLKKENENGLWTATMRANSEGRKEAWVYHSSEGILQAVTLSEARQVRCIGAPVR
jgi:hypothetical protein